MIEYHIPVLLKETIEFLEPKPGDIMVDCTLGGGGHSEEIIKRIVGKGKLVAIDQDPRAIEEGKKRLDKFGDRVVFVNDNFINLKNIVNGLGISGVDGVLLDLGVSTYQLETPQRGFSFGERGTDAPLDMRMNSAQQLSAFEVVNLYPEKELRRVFYELGEERFGSQIARQITKDREIKKIETCGELVDEIRKATPPKHRFSREHGHWASKVFRAIRMEVNQELPVLQETLPQTIEVLKSGGRLVIISFHSLEDKIVKHHFIEWQNAGLVEILTPQPVVATPEEIAANPKSDSAKLRAISKLDSDEIKKILKVPTCSTASNAVGTFDVPPLGWNSFAPV